MFSALFFSLLLEKLGIDLGGGNNDESIGAHIVMSILWIVCCSAGILYAGFVSYDHPRGIMTGELVFAIYFLSFFGWALYNVMRLFGGWATFRQQVLLLPETRNSDEEHEAILCFVFYLTILGLVILYYGFVYDPTGTVASSWTGVFG